MASKRATSDILIDMFSAKPWLFNKITPNIQFNDYILQINRKTDTAFFRYTCPHLFHADVMDQYEKNHIFSAPFEEKYGIGYLCVFGINPNTIVQANLGVQDEKMVVSVAIHTNSPIFYFHFLAENKKFSLPANISEK